MTNHRLPSLFSLVGALTLLPYIAPCQVQFAELDHQHLPPLEQDTRDITHGDVDGDGDADLLLAVNGINQLYLNDGAGVFAAAPKTAIPRYTDPSQCVAVGDFDRDGDLDVFFGNRGQNRIYLNDGHGRFTDGTPGRIPVAGGDTFAAVPTDVDGDGDLDLVVGNGRADWLYRNDGRGYFTEDSASSLPTHDLLTRAVATGDIDGDGDPDLIIGTVGPRFGGPSDRQDRVYRNEGSGRFLDVTSTALPTRDTDTLGLQLVDLDGDGDPDLVAVGPRDDRVLVNDGQGRFVEDPAFGLPSVNPRSRGIAVEDFDGDGDPDIVIAESVSRLYRNEGRGGLVDISSTHLPDAKWGACVTVVDVDADGDLDIVFGAAVGRDWLHLNNGSGEFLRCGVPRIEGRWLSPASATGDVDGDGDRDIVLAVGGQNRLLLNDSRGRFADATATHFPAISDDSRAIALADVDGDGDEDVVIARYRARDGLWLNDGTGRFRDVSSTHMPDVQYRTTAILPVDVDADGDPDLLTSERCYRNDGNGVFTDVTAAVLPANHRAALDLAMGDFDGDGILDHVRGNWGQTQLFLGDGSGRFLDATAGRLPADSRKTVAIATGDFDGDGDLDLVLANEDSVALLWENDGTGRFTDVTSGRLQLIDAVDVRVVDVDEDGDPDLVFACERFNHVPSYDPVWINDGRGRFVAERMAKLSANVHTILADDFDGDGDPDVVLGSWHNSLSHRLYVNLRRQIDSPHLARLGQTFQLNAYLRHGPTTTTNLVMPYLSPLPARIPLPSLGVLGLDPRTSLPLPHLAVPSSTGHAAIEFPVPAFPNLVGIHVYAQALVLEGSRAARLTNVTTDVVTR